MADIATRGGTHDRRGRRAHAARMERLATIPAGGDGAALRDLTRRIAGDDRPKQFGPLLGGETPLGETRRQVALGVPAPWTVEWSDLGRPERVLALRGRTGAPRAEIAGPPVLVAAGAGLTRGAGT